MAADLSGYNQTDVMTALETCRKTLKSRLTLAAIIEQINALDGHPSANEAWALALKSNDEYSTIVWTDEIAQAFGIAGQVMDAGDEVGARMAFKESYERIVSEARAVGKKAKYTVSLGYSVEGRAEAIKLAIEEGKLNAEHYLQYLPSPVSALLEAPKISEEEQAKQRDLIKNTIKAVSDSLKDDHEKRKNKESAERIEAERKRKSDVLKMIEEHQNAKATQQGA